MRRRGRVGLRSQPTAAHPRWVLGCCAVASVAPFATASPGGPESPGKFNGRDRQSWLGLLAGFPTSVTTGNAGSKWLRGSGTRCRHPWEAFRHGSACRFPRAGAPRPWAAVRLVPLGGRAAGAALRAAGAGRR